MPSAEASLTLLVEGSFSYTSGPVLWVRKLRLGEFTEVPTKLGSMEQLKEGRTSPPSRDSAPAYLGFSSWVCVTAPSMTCWCEGGSKSRDLCPYGFINPSNAMSLITPEHMVCCMLG